MKNTLYKPNRHWKEIELWKDVTDEQWNDWVWQLTNTIKTFGRFKESDQLNTRRRRRR